MLRLLLGIIGAGALLAMTHKTIMAGGKYDHGDIDTIAATLLVIGAALAIMSIFKAGHWIVGVAVIVALVAGDAARFGRTFMEEMDRITELQAPTVAATKRRDAAEKSLADALSALALIGNTSPRIDAALRAKAETEQGVREQTSQRGCRKGCTSQLALQMKSANTEVNAARDELQSRRRVAEVRVTKARVALKAIAVPPSISPTADLIGWSAATLNALLAGLKSIALNVGAIAMLAVAGHNLKLSRESESKPASIVESTHDQIARFAIDRYSPDADGQILLTDAYREYLQWCKRDSVGPVSMPNFIAEFNRLAARARLTVERDRANHVVVRGMSSMKLLEAA